MSQARRTRHNHITAFAMVAARWAQKAGLPAGNLWEPAIVRNMEREYENLRLYANLNGYEPTDANAQAAVIGIFAARLGVSA